VCCKRMPSKQAFHQAAYFAGTGRQVEAPYCLSSKNARNAV
jgi:hypothetical protein